MKLLKAERRECVKTLALSSRIDAEYQRLASAGPQHKERTTRVAIPLAAATGSALDAYQRHSQDVLQCQQGGKVDLSRVDAMVAVRMRVTGHSQADIEAALRQSAPTLREKPEGRDWGDYAHRTACYAFGATGKPPAWASAGNSGNDWKAGSSRSSNGRTNEKGRAWGDDVHHGTDEATTHGAKSTYKHSQKSAFFL